MSKKRAHDGASIPLTDARRGFVLPEAPKSSPGTVAMMIMLVAVAAGLHDPSIPLPPAPMWPEREFRAGCIHASEHVDFWLEYILPNSTMSAKQLAMITSVLKDGVQWMDMRRRSGSTVGLHPCKAMPNHLIRGDTADGSTSLHEWVTSELAKYERIGAIRYCEREDIDVVNPIGVEPRKPRLITDMRYTNLWCEPTPFRYGSLSAFRNELQKNDLLITVDLKDAFHHVRINDGSLRVFGGCWNSRYFVYTALPFGFNCSPVIFQTMMECVASALASLGIVFMVYLDDFCIRCQRARNGRSHMDCALETVRIVLSVFWGCGLHISGGKSKLVPSTLVQSLGFLIDTFNMTFRMLPARKEKIVELARDLAKAVPNVGSVPLHALRVFAGKGASLLLACPCLKMFLAPVWDAFSTVNMDTGMVKMTRALHDALCEFTMRQLDSWCLVARWRPAAHVPLHITGVLVGDAVCESPIDSAVIYSDASGGSKQTDGWGGIVTLADGTTRTRSGNFDICDRPRHINVKEAIAAVKLLQLSGVRDCYVTLHVDSMAVHGALTSYYTKHLEFRVPLRMSVVWQCENNVCMSVVYVPSKQNPADAPSRGVRQRASDSADFSLVSEIYQSVLRWADLVAEEITLDVCASRENAVVSDFVARSDSGSPRQRGVDCLAFNDLARDARSGKQHTLWVFPPWSIMSAVWSHLQATGARGIFLAPRDIMYGQTFEYMRSRAVRYTQIGAAGQPGVLCNPAGPVTLKTDLFALLFDFSTL